MWFNQNCFAQILPAPYILLSTDASLYNTNLSFWFVVLLQLSHLSPNTQIDRPQICLFVAIDNLDIDECRNGAAKCGPNMYCLNTIGSFQCLCERGYKNLDHETCVGECTCSWFTFPNIFSNGRAFYTLDGGISHLNATELWGGYLMLLVDWSVVVVSWFSHQESFLVRTVCFYVKNANSEITKSVLTNYSFWSLPWMVVSIAIGTQFKIP